MVDKESTTVSFPGGASTDGACIRNRGPRLRTHVGCDDVRCGTAVHLVAHGRRISLPFAWDLQLENSHLVGSIPRQSQTVIVRKPLRM